MDAVLLAIASAILFGATTVAMRWAFRRGALAEGGALFTVLVALGVVLPFAAAQGGFTTGVWPFLLAGLLGPGLSQFLFTFAVREAGAARTSVVIGMAPLFSIAIAVVLLGEPLEAALVTGAALIVAGGFLLVSERERPEYVRQRGLALALMATIVFASRDNLIRWLSVDTDVSPGVAAISTLAAGAALMTVFVVVGRAPVRAQDARAFAPAGVLFGLSYVLPVRGVLPGPGDRRLAARRHRVAMGCRARGDRSRKIGTRRASPSRRGCARGLRRCVDRGVPLAAQALLDPLEPLFDSGERLVDRRILRELALPPYALRAGDEARRDYRRDEGDHCQAEHHHEDCDDPAPVRRRYDVAVADSRHRLGRPPQGVSERVEAVRREDLDEEGRANRHDEP